MNPAFAAAHPDAVKGFLRAYLRAAEANHRRAASALGYVLERTDAGRKNLELDRLKMVIRENIVTPEVKANGYGGIDSERFARGIDQLAQSYAFKQKPKLDEIFDASFLPPRKARAKRIKPTSAQPAGARDLAGGLQLPTLTFCGRSASTISSASCS